MSNMSDGVVLKLILGILFAAIGTGTGKTLSFVLPLLERLSAEGPTRIYQGRPPLLLVMAPTRELAIQVNDKHSSCLV